MRLEDYWDELQEIQRKYEVYRACPEEVLRRAAENVHSSIIAEGEITTFLPYERERQGNQLDGKVRPVPVDSEQCCLYNYDEQGRIVLVGVIHQNPKSLAAQYICEHYEDGTSDCYYGHSMSSLYRMKRVDGHCDTVLAYVPYGGVGFFVERYFSENGRLIRTDAVRQDYGEGCFIERFHYQGDRLVRITAEDPEGKAYLLCYYDVRSSGCR